MNRANFPTVFDFSGSVAHRWLEIVPIWMGLYWREWLVALLVYAVLSWLIGIVRSGYFLKRGRTRLVDELQAEAERQAAAGFDASATPRERTAS